MGATDPSRALSIVVPTMGRQSLRHTLESMRPAGFTNGIDQLILVTDGRVPYAYELFNETGLSGKFIAIDKEKAGPSRPFNAGQDNATKPFVTFIDDDDSYMEGAFDTIREHAHDGLTVFLARSVNGVVIPRDPDPYNRFYPLTMVVARQHLAKWNGHAHCDTNYGRDVLRTAQLKKVPILIARHKH